MSPLVLRCSLLLLVLGAKHGPAVRGARSSIGDARVASSPAARTGAIEGRVELSGAQRRVASRYIDAGAPSHALQDVPAVVIVETVGGRAPVSGTVRIAQNDTAFSPAVIVVSTGTTVEFPNQDPFFHNVFSYSSAKRFDLGRFPRGESRSVRFDEPGIVKVYCEVHNFMRAAIIVTEHPLHVIVAPDGRFSIPAVPVGRQTLLLVRPEQGSHQVTVDVREGETTRVDVRSP